MLRTLMKCSFISPTILILRQEKMHSFQRNMKLKLKLIYQRTIQQMILHSLYQYGLLLKKSTKIYTETQVINYLVQGIFQKCSLKPLFLRFHIFTLLFIYFRTENKKINNPTKGSLRRRHENCQSNKFLGLTCCQKLLSSGTYLGT